MKVKELKATSFKKLSALSEASKHPGDMKVSMQRSHHLQDDDFTEVEDEHVTKGIFVKYKNLCIISCVFKMRNFKFPCLYVAEKLFFVVEAHF